MRRVTRLLLNVATAASLAAAVAALALPGCGARPAGDAAPSH